MAVDGTTSDRVTSDRVTSTGRPMDQEAQLWADLASNAVELANATEERCQLLVARARLWDQLADLSNPACGRAYRDAAATCRAEAAGHRLDAEPETAG
ncbi:MAG TPA: hypothetical protein VH141_00710 [Pseudonocardia sp.]|jgi:hypothetical protein|nr:hypothetical protein [Pseudonocardia sp.]